MQKSECFSLGKITKTHALKGEVIIFLDVDVPEDYSRLEAVFLEIKGQLVPYVVEELQMKGRKSILKLEDINSIETAQEIVNAPVWLPLSALPALKGNQFYYHDVIGYEIHDTVSATRVGTLRAIYESTGQDLFAIDLDGREVLVPIVDEFIFKIDHENRKIDLKLPEGLLEIYLNT